MYSIPGSIHALEAISGEWVTGGRLPIGREAAGHGCHWSVAEYWKHKEILETKGNTGNTRKYWKEILEAQRHTGSTMKYWKHKKILETQENT